MPKVKIPRKSTNIDMTAMCDVSFLLLTFFMLTAKFKPEEPVVVDTPSSTSQLLVPDKDMLLLTVDTAGRVFFTVTGKSTRSETLKKMGAEYSQGFTEAQVQKFGQIEIFGAPMEKMREVIDMNSAQRSAPGAQTGIPLDSVGDKASELHRWVQNTRITHQELFPDNEVLRIAIKADGKVPYDKVKKLIDVMQNCGVNRFNLITNLEAGPASKAVAAEGSEGKQ